MTNELDQEEILTARQPPRAASRIGNGVALVVFGVVGLAAALKGQCELLSLSVGALAWMARAALPFGR